MGSGHWLLLFACAPIGLGLLAFAAAATSEPPISTAADVDAGPAGERAVAECECSMAYDFERELQEAARTSLVLPVKQAKNYPPLWSPSKRQGLRRAWTTFYNVHTKEAVPVLENRMPPIEVFDELFRCRGFGVRQRVEQILVDTAVAAARHFKSDRVEIISGYRSPKFNDALAKKGRYVAAESKHTMGRALDIRVSNTPAAEVGRWLFENFEGGVGVYKKDDFVHIDTGAKRRWQGR